MPDSSAGEGQAVYRILNGSLFVGDAEFPLASPLVVFHVAEPGERSLRLSIQQSDHARFAEAWQRMVHSSSPYASGYPVSDLIPAGPFSTHTNQAAHSSVVYSEVTYVGVSYAEVLYLELRPEDVTNTDVSYLDVLYADVRYADVTYASATARSYRLGSAPVSALMALTITGDGEVGSRRILTVEGIEGADLRLDGSAAGAVDVLIRFTSHVPADQLVRAIEGS